MAFLGHWSNRTEGRAYHKEHKLYNIAPGAQWGALLSLHWVTGLSVEPLVPTKLRHLGISLVDFETVDHLADLLNH